MTDLTAGQIVIADWRDALPKEPNKLRPAVVVGDDGIFDPSYPSLILVPLTEDARLAIADLSVVIDPTPRTDARNLVMRWPKASLPHRLPVSNPRPRAFCPTN